MKTTSLNACNSCTCSTQEHHATKSVYRALEERAILKYAITRKHVIKTKA